MYHVIYVPGLGDAKPRGQRLITKLWRCLGVRGHYVAMHWADGDESWDAKLARLLSCIDELHKTGSVSLVGSSAGASAVLQAYAQRRRVIAAAVCVCGKIQRPETVNPDYYRHNPAFRPALERLPRALSLLSPSDRARILSIHPLWDGIVPVGDTQLPGVVERTIPTIGHAFSIFFALLFAAPGIMRFVKRQRS